MFLGGGKKVHWEQMSSGKNSLTTKQSEDKVLLKLEKRNAFKELKI